MTLHSTSTNHQLKVFDRDGTGTISKDELRAVMKSIGESLTEAEIDEMLHFADSDGSGTIDCKCKAGLTQDSN